MNYELSAEDREVARLGLNEMRPLVNDVRDQFLAFMDAYEGDELRAFAALVGYVNDRVTSGTYDRSCLVGMIAFMGRRLHYHTPLLTPSGPN